ncbi:transcriptional regulator of sorbose uptake and utilization genes [Escherichia coli]|nr:transcriptional regulator of sorbose uptake and utilization genes [Escherichia coli]STH13117.1 transcriptional regulator of sorbose uptake and utilization genes [Escherichia coli]STL47251.1 transcriptional regulator of sorbose uptake and utilization genes [Escherichia coli]
MENSDDIRLIVKIAQLYYEQDMTQAQIARETGYLPHHHQPLA